jgi:hypothetical protein
MKSSVKKRFIDCCVIVVLYIVTYLIFRTIFDVRGLYPVYTPGWTGRHFLWFAAFISALPALFGWAKFPYVTFAGFIFGNIAGELFGGFKSDIPPQFSHYGWLISIVVFFLSCAFGIYIELRINDRNEKG